MTEMLSHCCYMHVYVHVLMCLCLLPLRRCGYSKAKQDPEEEKMHFHNGHSKWKKSQTNSVYVSVGKFIQSLRYMYSSGFRLRSCLDEFVHHHTACVCAGVWRCFILGAILWMTHLHNLLHGSHVGRGHVKLWWFIGRDRFIYFATFSALYPAIHLLASEKTVTGTSAPEKSGELPQCQYVWHTVILVDTIKENIF